MEKWLPRPPFSGYAIAWAFRYSSWCGFKSARSIDRFTAHLPRIAAAIMKVISHADPGERDLEPDKSVQAYSASVSLWSIASYVCLCAEWNQTMTITLLRESAICHEPRWRKRLKTGQVATYKSRVVARKPRDAAYFCLHPKTLYYCYLQVTFTLINIPR